MAGKLRDVTIFIMYTVLCAHAYAAELPDLSVDQVKYFGYYKGERSVVNYVDGKKITPKEGETLRLEFNRFDETEGYNVSVMDVEATVYNGSFAPVKDIQVRLTVLPRVVYYVYEPDEEFSIYSPEKMRKTASWFSSILCLKKVIGSIGAYSSEKVVFDKIPLESIVEGYLKRELWPIELKFQISVEPLGPERRLGNNTVSRTLEIPIPPY